MKIKRQTKSIMKYNQGQRLLSSATYPEISLREPRIISKPGSYSRANTETKGRFTFQTTYLIIYMNQEFIEQKQHYFYLTTLKLKYSSINYSQKS